LAGEKPAEQGAGEETPVLWLKKKKKEPENQDSDQY
jgi:hypothetical protein